MQNPGDATRRDAPVKLARVVFSHGRPIKFAEIRPRGGTRSPSLATAGREALTTRRVSFLPALNAALFLHLTAIDCRVTSFFFFFSFLRNPGPELDVNKNTNGAERDAAMIESIIISRRGTTIDPFFYTAVNVRQRALRKVSRATIYVFLSFFFFTSVYVWPTTFFTLFITCRYPAK